MKNPWLKFYPTDWRADPSLRMCSLAARGLWIEMVGLMHEAEIRGQLTVKGKPIPVKNLALLVGCSPDELELLQQELEDNGVFSRKKDGVVFSRRMEAEASRETKTRQNGAKGGSPKLQDDDRKNGFIYLMGRRADGAYKIGASVNPTNRLKKIRHQYKDDDIKLLKQWETVSMSVSERFLHGFFEEKAEEEWFFLDTQDIEMIDELLDPLGSEGNGSNPQKLEARSQKLDKEKIIKKKKPEKYEWTDDRILTKADIELAESFGFSQFRLDNLWENFRSYWIEQGELKTAGCKKTTSGWSRTWRNRLLADIKYNGPPTKPKTLNQIAG